jgi:large subunit ribosomal protein LP2
MVTLHFHFLIVLKRFKMRHLAAYLLLTVGGNAKPTVEEVTAVLGQAGIETDSVRLSALFAELEGKDVEELIALGKEKLMVGGAMAASSAPAASAGAGKHPYEYKYVSSISYSFN